MNDITVGDIIEDIKRGNYYPFTITPNDEDEQIYNPPRKGNIWLFVAFCYMGKIKTENLIYRLESRRDAKVIRTGKRSSQLVITDTPKAQLPSLQDCIEILEEGKKNREKCCERLIAANAIGKDARETGEFDKVCSDCESCGEEVPE